MQRIAFSLVFLISLVSCKPDVNTFEHEGGTFHLQIEHFNPLSIYDEFNQYSDQLVYSQIFEGLMSIDPLDLTPRPQLVTQFDIKDEGKTYEFVLRTDVHFTNDAGETRLLVPDDVVYSMEEACRGNTRKGQYGYELLFKGVLKGADRFHSGESSSISGIRVKGNKIIFELETPDYQFLNKLALPYCYIFPKEGLQKKSHLMGTGPFVMTHNSANNNQIILERNEHYYQTDNKGNRLPYLDRVRFTVETSKMRQLDAFEKGETHCVLGLPSAKVTETLMRRMDDFNAKPPLMVMKNNAQLTSNYYVYNFRDERLKNPEVRKAIAYCISRQRIGTNVLNQQFFELGHYGIVPPLRQVFKTYGFQELKALNLSYDAEKAKESFRRAGYKNADEFGDLTILYPIDELSVAVANAIASQIHSVLGINVILDGVPREKWSEQIQNTQAGLIRYAWSADYPSPESFLVNFYNQSPKINYNINVGGFNNPRFNELIALSKSEKNVAKRREIQLEAEKILMKDVAFIPLWYSGDVELLYAEVRNLNFNPLQMILFKEVYLKEWTKEEFINSIKK